MVMTNKRRSLYYDTKNNSVQVRFLVESRGRLLLPLPATSPYATWIGKYILLHIQCIILKREGKIIRRREQFLKFEVQTGTYAQCEFVLSLFFLGGQGVNKSTLNKLWIYQYRTPPLRKHILQVSSPFSKKDLKLQKQFL